MTQIRLVLAITAAALLSAVAAEGASIDCNRAVAIPGGVALVEVSLTTDPGEEVNGTQNDLEFDDSLFDVSREGSDMGNCRIDPRIGPGSPVGKNLFSSILENPPRLRGFVLALSNLSPIPNGPLYACNFSVAEDAPLGTATLPNVNLGVSPRGDPTGTDCLIDIVTPTPTATEVPPCEDDMDCPPGQTCVDGTCLDPTPTPTPIGFCTEDSDCDPGEVCVADRCTAATPTPSATPVGFCTGNDDCPPGEICIDSRCTVLTPTRTATPIGFCTDDGDCPVGEVCIDESCTPLTPTPIGFCTEDGDCPAGEVCIDGTCTALTPTRTATPIGFCTDDEDCPAGETCIDETCTRPTPTPIGFCRGDEDCTGGEVCVGDECRTRTPTQPPPSTATATVTRTPAGFCNEDGDCPSGEVCEGNACVAPKQDDDDSGCQITPAGSEDGAAFLALWLIPAVLLNRRRGG